jgi:acid phosphatase type 7
MRMRAVRPGLPAVLILAFVAVAIALWQLPSGPGIAPARPPVVAPPPVSGDAAVLVGAGDIATCSGGADDATASLLDGIAGTVFAAGDDAYPHGRAKDFADCYGPTWGRHLGRTLPALGNHDYDADARAAPYFAYFGSHAGTPGDGWYAVGVGTWRVIVLNSNCERIECGPSSPEATWLASELAAHPAACIAAIWHHARFSSGEHRDDARTAGFWTQLQAAHAELVLVGHDHDYERFAPMLADGTPSPDGMREFVVGTGGIDLRRIDSLRHGSEVRQDDSHGVLRLALRPDGYDWAFIPIPGDTFTDAGSATCH